MATVANKLKELEKQLDDQQNHIYILAGVLGGVDLVILIGLVVLLVMIVQIKKKIRDAEIQKRVEEEMNAQKLTAYTGEEMHRKLLAVSTPAVPLSTTGPVRPGHDEYAFNPAFVDNRMGRGPPSQGGSRLHRY